MQMIENSDLNTSNNDDDFEEVQVEQSSKKYVNPADELFDKLLEENIKKGFVKVSDKEEVEVEQNNTDTETNTVEDNKKDEPVIEPKPEVEDKYAERFSKQESELNELRNELRQAQALLLEQLKKEVKEPEKAVEVKPSKEELRKAKEEKIKSGLSKILNGDADSVEELTSLLTEEKEVIDVVALKKEALEDLRKEMQIQQQRNEIESFTKSYVDGHEELKNEAFLEIFNRNLSMVANEAENYNLDMKGLYDKALGKSVSFAEKLGFKLQQSKQTNTVQETVEELELKAKMEKAKNASVTNTGASGKSSNKKANDLDGKADQKYILESFLRNNHYK